MTTSQRRGWLNCLARFLTPKGKAKSRRTPLRTRPRLEWLEDRLAPATFNWIGIGADSKFSDGANWNGGKAPTGSAAALDDLVFPSTAAQKTAINDLVGATFKSITFAGSGYRIGGNTITLGDPSVSGSGSIVVQSGLTNENITVNLALNAASGAKQFITVNAGAQLTITGQLSGGSGVELTKEGAGTLVLSADNTPFLGSVDVDAGVLQITNANALGAGVSGSTTVASGAQLQINSASSISVSEPLLLNGSGINADGALDNVGGNNFLEGAVQLDGDTTIGAAAGQLTIDGAISDTGAGHNLTKEGIGAVVLTAANTYRGATTINNGILEVENALALGFADGTAATGAIVNQSVTKAGTLEINDPTGAGFVVANKLLTLNGAGFGGAGALFSADGANSWTGAITLGSPAPDGSAVTIDVAAGGTFDEGTGMISGSQDLTKDGAGTLVLSGANTYGGVTDIQAGVLVVANASALGGASAGTTVESGAALWLQSDLQLEPLTLNGDGLAVGGHNTGALRSIGGNNTVTGTIVLKTDATIGVDPGSTLTVGAKASLLGTGTITDNGQNKQLTKELTGTLVLQSANTYGGKTEIDQGVLQVQNAQALGGTAAGTEVRDGAQLQLQTPVIGPLAGQPVVVSGESLTLSGTGMSGGGALLDTGGNNAWQGPITLASVPGFSPPTNPPADVAIGVANAGDNLTLAGVISELGGSFGLTKVGPGLLILDAANTYGGTTIDAGVVQVDGSIGAVALAGGGLSGKGGAGAVSGTAPLGSIDPGDNGGSNPIGILTIGGATLGADVTLTADLSHTSAGSPVAGTDYDQLDTTGALNLNRASLALNLGSGVQVGDSFVIVQTPAGQLSGVLAQGNAVFVNGRKFSITYDYVNGQVILQRVLANVIFTVTSSVNPSVYGQPVTFTATVIPEPGAGPIPATDTVTFTFDNVSYPAQQVGTSGVVTFDPQAATGGPLSVTTPSTLHTLHVAFSGDATQFSGNTTDLTPAQEVDKANTSLVINSVHLNQATGKVTFTATVSAVAPGAGTPTGVVTIADKGSLLINPNNGTNFFPLDGNGVVTATLSLSSPSPHDLVATYLGDGNFNGSGPSAAFTFGDLKVLSVAPALPLAPPTKLSQITITFNRAVNPGSFDLTDLALTDPNHNALTLHNLTDANPGTDTIWTVDLVTPQSAPGNYTLTVGPDITDVANFEMDQNGDGVNGGAGDQFSTTFVLQAGPMTYSGSGQLKLELDATGADLQFFVNNVLQDSRSLASITTITVDGSVGADTLTLDYTNGVFLKPITFDGGGGGDTLQLTGSALASLTYQATAPHAGTLILNGDTTDAVQFSNLAPVVVASTVGTTTVTIGDNSPHTATFTAGPGAGENTVAIDGGLESMTFTDPTTALVVNGNGAGDAFTFSSLDAGFTAGAIRVNGGSGKDTLNLDAAGAAVGTAPGAVFLVKGARTVSYTSVEAININNAVAVNALAGPNTSARATAFVIDPSTNLPFVPPLTANERYAQALYLDALGRAGSRAEIDGWAARFNGQSQAQAQAQIAAAIEHSAEGRDRQVKAWYAAFLGRQAQGGEEQPFVSMLLAGQTEEQVLSQILGSGEFFSRAQTLGLGDPTANGNYVRALYLLLLNRPASSAEVAGWVNALPQVGRQGAALDFLQSREFRIDDFEGYYDALLHRPSDPAGLNSWVMSNLDVGAVRIGFESTAEFFAIG